MSRGESICDVILNTQDSAIVICLGEPIVYKHDHSDRWVVEIRKPKTQSKDVFPTPIRTTSLETKDEYDDAEEDEEDYRIRRTNKKRKKNTQVKRKHAKPKNNKPDDEVVVTEKEDEITDDALLNSLKTNSKMWRLLKDPCDVFVWDAPYQG